MVLASFIPKIPAGFTFTRYVIVTSIYSRKAIKDDKKREKYLRIPDHPAKINFTYVDFEAGTEYPIPDLPMTLEQLYIEHEPETWGPEQEFGMEPEETSLADFDFSDWDTSFAKVVKRLGVKEKDILRD